MSQDGIILGAFIRFSYLFPFFCETQIISFSFFFPVCQVLVIMDFQGVALMTSYPGPRLVFKGGVEF